VNFKLIFSHSHSLFINVKFYDLASKVPFLSKKMAHQLFQRTVFASIVGINTCYCLPKL